MISKRSFSKVIEEAGVMLQGIKTQKTLLSTRGVDDTYIAKFETIYKNCVDINSQQEKTKADLATLTVTLNKGVEELIKEIQYVKRVVMTEVPKSGWREFGMVYRPRKPKPEEETPTDTEPVATPGAPEKKEQVKTQS